MDIFCMLGSGSSGNSAYLRAGDTALLVDAGLSCRRILSGIKALGEDPGKLEGILITHEHIDHIRGLAVLTKQLKLPVYAAPAVADHLRDTGAVYDPRYIKELTGEFSLGGLHVIPFPVSHDSVDCRGFRLELSKGHSFGYATDIGVMTDTVLSHLTGCQTVVLESNYDEGMLEVGPYPYSLKRRIKSPGGHLSNEECANALVKLVQTGTKQLVLAHLSRENNMPELARSFAVGTLLMAGIPEQEYHLQIASRDLPSPALAI